MKYILTPTDDDILHYKKGSESKSHKYISRVLNKGKWVYVYAKNRLRGNKVITNQTKGTTPYNPTIKTIDTNRDIGGTLIDTRHGGQEIRKALAENMTAETKVSGLTLFGNIMNTGREYSITNNTGRNSMSKVSSQYTPEYKTPDSSKHYTPNIKTNMPVNPSLKTPISYTQTNINTSKYNRLIQRDLGQKSLAEQYAELEKKNKK